MAEDIKRIDLVDIDLNSGKLHRSFFSHSIGTTDVKGNGFGVRVFRDGEPVDLTGVSVQGYFRDPQGNNIGITSGNVSASGDDNNEAYVILPAACYNYEGRFQLAIKLVSSTITGTVRIVEGMVDNTNTGGAIVPPPATASYDTVLAAFEQVQPLVDAGGVATVAQTKSHLGIT